MLVLIVILAVVALLAVSSLSLVVVRRRRGAGQALDAPPVAPGAPAAGVVPVLEVPEGEELLGEGAAGEAAGEGAGEGAAGEAAGEGAGEAAGEGAGEGEEAPDLATRIGRTRGIFSHAVRALRGRSRVDDAVFDEIEEAMLRGDVGLATTTELLDGLRAKVKTGELRDPEAVLGALGEELVATLDSGGDSGLAPASEGGGPDVWLFVGVNGVGKTTSIGKVALRESGAGRSVLLAAGDTFRAAAGEQLETWAERTGVELVRGADGGDPSAVVFDAVQRAAARGNDLVLADTAGRLHTKVNLVEELKKIRRIADRPPGKVREVLLVLDATTGQNGLAQARQFTDAVGVTGVVLTKLDGTAKGGIVVAIVRELGVPVKLVGVGEGVRDLLPFDAKEFVTALLG